jgi:hypothetical protein
VHDLIQESELLWALPAEAQGDFMQRFQALRAYNFREKTSSNNYLERARFCGSRCVRTQLREDEGRQHSEEAAKPGDEFVCNTPHHYMRTNSLALQCSDVLSAAC